MVAARYACCTSRIFFSPPDARLCKIIAQVCAVRNGNSHTVMLRLGGTVATVALTPDTRARALEEMSDAHGLDILVIGGGVTGAGIALDAASRGLRTGIIEAQDWASGTSSRSSKLVHGGLRYLQMLDFTLVHEALTERDLLLSDVAPHLVRKVPFLYPLEHHVWERLYVGSDRKSTRLNS